MEAETDGGGRTAIFVPGMEDRPELYRLVEELRPPGTGIIRDPRELAKGSWDFTIWDRRETDTEELRRWISLGVPVGIDEGGAARQIFPILVDTFPIPPEQGSPNIADPGFLPQPAHRREPPESFKRVLISFGGEDPARLTEKMTAWLLDEGRFSPEDLTVVIGPLFGDRTVPEGVGTLQSPENLAELLADYDLVFTSFGLTAYEAAAAGAGVLLLNPSEYHSVLSRLAGFTEIGVMNIEQNKLERCLREPAPHIPILKKLVPFEARDLAGFLLELSPPKVTSCPVCGQRESKAVVREESRSFFTCGDCGTIYQVDFADSQDSYTEEYFFSEYRQQYGRTYLEDFEKIRGLSKQRLRIIGDLLVNGGAGIGAQGAGIGAQGAGHPAMPSGGLYPALLDVGCAYGPFLKEADEAGFRVTGLDVAETAVHYVRDTLGFSAYHSSFEAFDAEPCSYDVLTMWYVVEHFSDTDAVLKKAARLLKPGGIVALSTPNSSGISGRRDIGEFLRRSPRDHHIVWSPELAEKVLARYGLTGEKVVITGHHPERFPSFKAVRLITGPFGYRLLKSFSRFAGLGDTFEIYARKTGESNG
jgi:2-polyprenyl-3-methyl-5-hydroxy-6-metoxy-1,4-benzoquinol methylase